jgi:Zn-dependent protease with chaperone function
MPDAAESPILNPFPFATETHFRFSFLILVALVTTAAAGLLVPLALVRDVEPIAACLEPIGVLGPEGATVDVSKVQDAVGGVQECLAATAGHGFLYWSGLLVTALVAATGGFAVLDGRSKRRRHGLVEMPGTVRALVVPRIETLAAEMGLQKLPRIHLMPLRAGADAFVFGRNGSPHLALSQGALLLAARAPASFDTLVAHELAHVANRDLSVHLLTRSVGAALFCVVLPLYLLLSMTEPIEPARFIANEAVRVALIGLVVVLARNAISRSRERYADLRASLVPRVRPMLDALLAERPKPPKWWLPFSTNPPPGVRRRGLASTDDLFAPQFGTAFAFGFALSPAILTLMFVSTMMMWDLMLESIARLLSGEGGRSLAVVLWGPSNFAVALFATALAPIVWRTSHAEALTGRRAHTALQTALGVALGAVVGGYGALAAGPMLQGFGPNGRMLADSAQRLALGGASLAFLVAVLWGYFAWLRRAALAWTPRLVRSSRGPRLVLPLSLLIAMPLAVLLPPCLFVCQAAVFLGGALGPSVPPASLVPMLWTSVVGMVLMHPLAPAMVLVAGLLPLAAAALPRRDPSDWFLLSGRIETPAIPQLSIRPALAVGLFGGVATALGLFYAPGTVWLFDYTANPFAQVAVVALPIGAAALAGAILARVMAFEHGLLAAVVATVLIAVGYVVHYGWSSGLTAVRPVAIYGFGFAVLGGLAGAGLRAALRAVRHDGGATSRGSRAQTLEKPGSDRT